MTVDEARVQLRDELIRWAKWRWDEEVSKRPDENIHKRTLDGTWKQMIAKLESIKG